MGEDPRRALPAIDRLVTDALVARHGAARVAAHARAVVAEARERASEGVPTREALEARLAERLRAHVEPVINATGVVLHTNLGRAPWSPRAIEAAARASGYALVELDGASGRRGARGAGVEDRLRALTGAEAALTVNNGAAALVLALAALARGGRVIVSRGQLVEIGGGFRIPEILETSGAELVEVGTTNRTRASDYARAIDERTQAILWVHASNFRQVGFVASPSIAELTALGPPVIADLGSGALVPVEDEPVVGDAIAAGAELACFSGDKLLGGPQAGIALGRRASVERLARHPLARALRADKVTLAALEATLDGWLTGQDVPARAMIHAPLEALRAAVEGWRARLPRDVDAELLEVDGAIGGGSTPGRRWPSVALAIRAPSPEALRAALFLGTPRVLARIRDGALLLDARTVAPLGASDALVEALLAALARVREPSP
ncbi:MAG: L-seryl-tRNA(Sec) selenium transferase [Sandaracinaceae bacterium]|nr:L-seryl-tRNA(Sec) selenium transferase [Sandaracinaceae bacterium]